MPGAGAGAGAAGGAGLTGFSPLCQTDVGDILIAMNPFQPLPLYGREVSPRGPPPAGPRSPQPPHRLSAPQVAERYRHPETGTLPPHIFAVASRAYHAMLGRRGGGPRSQSIVIR